MRRPFLLAVLLLLAGLAGCSDGGGDPKPTDDGTDFDDFDVKPTDTKGVLLGVVVDDAIRPVEGAKVQLALPDGSKSEKVTDAEGRFAYGDLEPGIYLLQVSHLQYTTAQSSVEVKAGEEDPKVNRFMLQRLFDQEPFTEQVVFDGFLACAYAVGVSSTCFNDYTRVVGERCTPVGGVCTTQCAGGCLKEHELAKKGGNIREYVSTVGPGWQSVIFEMTWEPTSTTGEELGFTVSYFSRPDASHWFGSQGGPDPVRMQLDVGVEHESAQYADGQPTMVPLNGTDELFTFFSANDENVAVNQQFKAFQTTFYYGIPPPDWSFVAGNPRPY